LDRIAVAGQPKQESEDRAEHDSKDAQLKTRQLRRERAGRRQLGQDSWDRTSGTGQQDRTVGDQNSCDRTAGTRKQSQAAVWTGQFGQDNWD
jgi:hypothetical protein